MRRKVISLFLSLIVVCIVLSCKAEVLKDGENINSLLYPYLEFTLSEDGSYYTAEVIENVRLERVEIPEAVDNLGLSIPVLYFNGFKRADDSSSLKTLVLSTSKTRVTSSTLKNASSFNKLEIKKIDGSATIPELPVIEKDGKEFLGWFIPGTETKVSSGDSISLSSLSIEPRWKDHSLVYHEGKEATCTEDGWTEYYTCKTCSYNTKKIIPKLGHKLLHHEEIKATCTESGIRDYYECTRCGKHFSDSEGIYEISKIVIPALTHNLSIHKNIKEATCIEEGYKEYWQCERCKEYFLSNDPNSNPVDWKNDIVLPKTDHTYSPEWSHDTNNHYHVCSVCGAIEESSVEIHVFEIKLIKEPTQEKSGINKYTCTVCSYSYVVPIHSNGHLYDENSKVEIHNPTCTEIGFTRKYCSYKGCDYYKDDNFVEPLHHKNAKHYDAKSATCIDDGNYEYWYCPDCGKYFLSEYKTTPVEEERTIIGKLGHQYSEEWNHDNNGHYHKCVRCDSKIDITTHTINQKTIKTEAQKSSGTCTSPAIYYMSCVCGYCPKDESKTFTYGAALGHNLTIHNERKEATCGDVGNTEYWECSRCKHLFSDKNATKEITEEDTVIKPTGKHTHGGYIEAEGKGHRAICSVCGQGFGEISPHNNETVEIDASYHGDKCKDCGYVTNKQPHNFVNYGTDLVCSVCLYAKDKQNTTGGGFDIQPENKEPKGKIELIKIAGGYKASFILDEGSKMTAIKWFVDENEIVQTSECIFSTPDSRSYRVMCVVFNEDLVASYSEMVVGGNNN